MEDNQEKYNEVEFWIACSGGLDSVFLVHLFFSLNKKIGILHCNFKLRHAESDGDELFVRELADTLNIPIQVRSFDVNTYKKSSKTNTQLAARELRYAWFDEIKVAGKSRIVLGHHRDDQRETFFLQLVRGASVNGLAAMPYERNGYIRPLLGYTKEELRTICLKSNWKWREDSSNHKDDYARNDLRLNLLPKLVESGLKLRLVDELIECYQHLLNYIEKNKLTSEKGDFHITLDKWRNLPTLYKNALLEDVGFGKNNIDLVEQIVYSNKGAFATRNAIELWNEGGYLRFIKSSEDGLIPKLSVIPVQHHEIDFRSGDLFVDADKIVGTIYCRYWKEGDEFSPLGLKGNKKISDFLKDKKVPSSEKKHHIVVTDNQGVIGVIGFLPSNRVKISSATKHFYRLFVDYLYKK